MAGDIPSANLQTALEQRCEKVRKPRFTVLFRQGDRMSGMFVVLSGKVSLGFGVDSAFDRSYGPGALLGLAAYAHPAQLLHDRDSDRGRRTRFLESRGVGLVIAQPSRPLPTITGDPGREDG